MNTTISDTMLKKYGLSKAEVLYAIILTEGITIADVEEQLLNKKYIVEDEGIIKITQGFQTRVQNLLLDSDKHKEKPERISNLVKRLQEVFPKGKKDGGVYYWKGNTSEISNKLNTFFKKYGKDTYTDDEIVDAAKRYVESFNGKYTYMFLLKYFILKNKVEEGEIVEVSELLSYLENKEQTSQKLDWTSQIR